MSKLDMISNDIIQLEVCGEDGAQIKSLVSANIEYMWSGDQKYWGRTAPVLFPFVGKLKDDKYEYNNQVYPMSQHGFARDRKFELTAKTATSLDYTYSSSSDDFAVYPFEFVLKISYQLVENSLITSYCVTNKSAGEMLFQIGAHPGFNVESVDDITLHFPKQTVTKYIMEDGLQKSCENHQLEDIELSYQLIDVNLPCFSNFSNKQLLVKNKGKDFLHFDFTSMEHLAIWSPEEKNAKFVCVEPWVGICSRQDQIDYALEHKDAMTTLKSDESFSCSFTTTICKGE